MSLYRNMVHAVVHVFSTEELEDLARLIDAVLMERGHPKEDWDIEEEGEGLDSAFSVSTQNLPASLRPRYRNPLNPNDVWSGRGLKPTWFKALLEQGYSPEDLKVRDVEATHTEASPPCVP